MILISGKSRGATAIITFIIRDDDSITDITAAGLHTYQDYSRTHWEASSQYATLPVHSSRNVWAATRHSN
ncbi:hypothetical protein CLV51_10287 [Chitinophaga niastensis]|uniref:Uncharacterized protein n=1 Tax=Chitinophaga niastensis TaxID=536980 RepID=A0A2P8HM00_CHINA|nr:hypothetical protein [Chitinophaga niastensis]PSL47242.1 hypothetical protein CLV51_10287 [Chitinophaga niastensis]